MMLLDEPTAGMGHEDVGRVAELIRKVSANRTVLMVEHYLSVVADLSDVIRPRSPELSGYGKRRAARSSRASARRWPRPAP